MPYMSKRQTDNGAVPVGSNLYGTCSTGGSSQIKYVTLSDFNVLVTGVTIHVYFSYGNTASSPILQVGSTSGQYIKCNGSLKGKWESGSIISFTFDGSYWVMNDFQEASSNTTYDLTQNGNTIYLTGSDGTTDSVTVSTPSFFVDGTSCVFYLTISAGGYVDNYYNAAWSGYTVIGVVGYNISNQDTGGANASHCVLVGCYETGDTVYIKVKNNASSQAKVQVRVFILYKSV